VPPLQNKQRGERGKLSNRCEKKSDQKGVSVNEETGVPEDKKPNLTRSEARGSVGGPRTAIWGKKRETGGG